MVRPELGHCEGKTEQKGGSLSMESGDSEAPSLPPDLERCDEIGKEEQEPGMRKGLW